MSAKERRPLRRRLRASAIRAASAASAGPGDAFVRAFLGGAAGLMRWSRFERVALENLALAMPELAPARRREIARGVRRHAARIVHEWLVMARAGRSERERREIETWVAERVELDPSIARLDELARAGRGLLIVTAHLGNWELLAATLRRRGLDGAVIGLHRRKDPSSDWLVAMRAALGVRTLAQDEPPRRALEVLRGGATLGVLCDLAVRRLASEPVPFFGRPALTLLAPAALARAARMPLLPVRCVARGGRYVLSVEEPLELRGGERREASLDLLARVNATFERWVREDPEQWAWHQPRWRDADASEDELRALRTPLHARRTSGRAGRGSTNSRE